MKKVMIAAVVFCSAFAACQGSQNLKSYSPQDSMAYAYGVWVGSDFKRGDSTLNTAAFAAAFQDYFAGKEKMTAEEASAFLNDWFTVRKPEMDKAANQEWFDELKAANPKLQTTESGLMYEIVNPGDETVKATAADQVVAKYRGTLRNGTEFDANDSATFPLSGVIRGWTEGLQLIGKGGEIVLWVPSDLGYGPQGGGPIPPNAALKFEVTLLDVIPAETAAPAAQ